MLERTPGSVGSARRRGRARRAAVPAERPCASVGRRGPGHRRARHRAPHRERAARLSHRPGRRGRRCLVNLLRPHPAGEARRAGLHHPGMTGHLHHVLPISPAVQYAPRVEWASTALAGYRPRIGARRAGGWATRRRARQLGRWGDGAMGRWGGNAPKRASRAPCGERRVASAVWRAPAWRLDVGARVDVPGAAGVLTSLYGSTTRTELAQWAGSGRKLFFTQVQSHATGVPSHDPRAELAFRGQCATANAELETSTPSSPPTCGSFRRSGVV